MIEAAAYAAEMHRDQRRKGRLREPYVNHVLEVAARLEAAHPEDGVLIVGGLLHDVIEDCADWTDPAGPRRAGAEIGQRFGAEVAALVWEVTDDKALSKEARKQRQIVEVAKKSDRAKRLKFADLTANVASFEQSPPDWPAARTAAYFDWAETVLRGARGVSPALELAFDRTLSRARTSTGAIP